MVSLLAHATDQYQPVKELGERVTDQSCQKTIFSFQCQYPPWFETNADGMVKDGETFPIFMSKKVWVGSDGRSGARAKYLITVNTAVD
jgi:hypothetical protein